jgi:hypothetical protein
MSQICLVYINLSLLLAGKRPLDYPGVIALLNGRSTTHNGLSA